MPVLQPETPIAELQAVDNRLGSKLEKIGCHTAGDLLTYYPRRYEDRGQFNAFPICETGSAVCLRGDVIDTAKRFFGRRRFFVIFCFFFCLYLSLLFLYCSWMFLLFFLSFSVFFWFFSEFEGILYSCRCLKVLLA